MIEGPSLPLPPGPPGNPFRPPTRDKEDVVSFLSQLVPPIFGPRTLSFQTTNGFTLSRRGSDFGPSRLSARLERSDKDSRGRGYVGRPSSSRERAAVPRGARLVGLRQEGGAAPWSGGSLPTGPRGRGRLFSNTRTTQTKWFIRVHATVHPFFLGNTAHTCLHLCLWGPPVRLRVCSPGRTPGRRPAWKKRVARSAVEHKDHVIFSKFLH